MTRSDLYDVATDENGDLLSAALWKRSELVSKYLNTDDGEQLDALIYFVVDVERTAFLVGFEAAVSLFMGKGANLMGHLKDGAAILKKEDKE